MQEPVCAQVEAQSPLGQSTVQGDDVQDAAQLPAAHAQDPSQGMVSRGAPVPGSGTPGSPSGGAGGAVLVADAHPAERPTSVATTPTNVPSCLKGALLSMDRRARRDPPIGLAARAARWRICTAPASAR